MTTPLTDWAGNEIRDGDTIMEIKIKEYRVIESYYPNDGFITQVDKLDPNDYKYTWEVIRETDYNTYLNKYGYIGDSYIRCIKGLSDNEEAFYLEYFKVK